MNRNQIVESGAASRRGNDALERIAMRWGGAQEWKMRNWKTRDETAVSVEQEGQHPMTGQRAPPISGGT